MTSDRINIKEVVSKPISIFRGEEIIFSNLITKNLSFHMDYEHGCIVNFSFIGYVDISDFISKRVCPSFYDIPYTIKNEIGSFEFFITSVATDPHIDMGGGLFGVDIDGIVIVDHSNSIVSEKMIVEKKH